MFTFFLASACLSFVLLFTKPLMTYSRWAALVIGLLSFVNAALVLIASAIGTALFVIISQVVNNASQVNIKASLGRVMFATMWCAAAFALFSWIIDLCLMCCCASIRDVRQGRKRGSKKAYIIEIDNVRQQEEP